MACTIVEMVNERIWKKKTLESISHPLITNLFLSFYSSVCCCCCSFLIVIIFFGAFLLLRWLHTFSTLNLTENKMKKLPLVSRSDCTRAIINECVQTIPYCRQEPKIFRQLQWHWMEIDWPIVIQNTWAHV